MGSETAAFQERGPLILHLPGFDHEQPTYGHNGRDYRLTDVAGHVVRDILG